jgi:hypothetical protein
MDTNQNYNKFHFSNKESEQKTGRKKWNAEQLAFPFFCNPLIQNENKK